LKLKTKEFIVIQLDVAATFIRIAKASGVDGAVRNRQYARKAYDTAVDSFANTTFPQPEAVDIVGKLTVLKSDVLLLGESF
jgi:hypothetical protein